MTLFYSYLNINDNKQIANDVSFNELLSGGIYAEISLWNNRSVSAHLRLEAGGRAFIFFYFGSAAEPLLRGSETKSRKILAVKSVYMKDPFRTFFMEQTVN